MKRKRHKVEAKQDRRERNETKGQFGKECVIIGEETKEWVASTQDEIREEGDKYTKNQCT